MTTGRAEKVDDASGSQNLLRPSLEELIPLARVDFWCFVELSFPVLHPGQRIDFAPYLEVLAQSMMRVEQGRYRRLVINLPPRHMKSLIVSILYVAWRLGRNPTAKFITISYGDDLAHDHAAITRKLMQSPLYGRIFPGTVLVQKAVDYVRTTKGGYRYATSVGSDITGFGADEIIIDDPLQPDEAASEHAKEKIRSWVQSSVLTRFNDPRKGALILVMHRLAPDDLSATMQKEADFVLRLPLVAEVERPFKINNRLVMRRFPGDILNPARMNEQDVEKLKASLPRHVWDSQYQQRPSAGGSGMLSIGAFRRFDLSKPPAFELIMHSWDIGATTSGNPSVCTKWGLRHGKDDRDALYLFDVVRLRLEVPEVLSAIKAADRRDKPALIVMDERGVGMGLYQTLLRDGYRNLAPSTATKDAIDRSGYAPTRPSASKIERFAKASLYIADGKVLLPLEAPWLEAFLYEVAAFPNIADDDQVDSMTQIVANFDIAVRNARRNAQNR